MRNTNALLELLITSNSVVVDFGSFLNPTNSSFNLDFNGLLLNGFMGSPAVNQLDFGPIVVI